MPQFEKNEFRATLRSFTIPVLTILIATFVGVHISGLFEVLIVLIGLIVVLCSYLGLLVFSTSEFKWTGICLALSGVVSVFVNFHLLLPLWNVLSVCALILFIPGVIIIYLGRRAIENQNTYYEVDELQETSRYRYPNPYRVTDEEPEPSFLQDLWYRKGEIFTSLLRYLLRLSKDVFLVILSMIILFGDWIGPIISGFIKRNDDDTDGYDY